MQIETVKNRTSVKRIAWIILALFLSNQTPLFAQPGIGIIPPQAGSEDSLQHPEGQSRSSHAGDQTPDPSVPTVPAEELRTQIDSAIDRMWQDFSKELNSWEANSSGNDTAEARLRELKAFLMQKEGPAQVSERLDSVESAAKSEEPIQTEDAWETAEGVIKTSKFSVSANGDSVDLNVELALINEKYRLTILREREGRQLVICDLDLGKDWNQADRAYALFDHDGILAQSLAAFSEKRRNQIKVYKGFRVLTEAEKYVVDQLMSAGETSQPDANKTEFALDPDELKAIQEIVSGFDWGTGAEVIQSEIKRYADIFTGLNLASGDSLVISGQTPAAILFAAAAFHPGEIVLATSAQSLAAIKNHAFEIQKIFTKRKINPAIFDRIQYFDEAALSSNEWKRLLRQDSGIIFIQQALEGKPRRAIKTGAVMKKDSVLVLESQSAVKISPVLYRLDDATGLFIPEGEVSRVRVYMRQGILEDHARGRNAYRRFMQREQYFSGKKAPVDFVLDYDPLAGHFAGTSLERFSKRDILRRIDDLRAQHAAAKLLVEKPAKELYKKFQQDMADLNVEAENESASGKEIREKIHSEKLYELNRIQAPQRVYIMLPLKRLDGRIAYLNALVKNSGSERIKIYQKDQQNFRMFQSYQWSLANGWLMESDAIDEFGYRARDRADVSTYRLRVGYLGNLYYEVTANAKQPGELLRLRGEMEKTLARESLNESKLKRMTDGTLLTLKVMPAAKMAEMNPDHSKPLGAIAARHRHAVKIKTAAIGLFIRAGDIDLLLGAGLQANQMAEMLLATARKRRDGLRAEINKVVQNAIPGNELSPDQLLGQLTRAGIALAYLNPGEFKSLASRILGLGGRKEKSKNEGMAFLEWVRNPEAFDRMMSGIRSDSATSRRLTEKYGNEIFEKMTAAPEDRAEATSIVIGSSVLRTADKSAAKYFEEKLLTGAVAVVYHRKEEISKSQLANGIQIFSYDEYHPLTWRKMGRNFRASVWLADPSVHFRTDENFQGGGFSADESFLRMLEISTADLLRLVEFLTARLYFMEIMGARSEDASKDSLAVLDSKSFKKLSAFFKELPTL